MEKTSQRIEPALAQELFLLGRANAIAETNRLLNGEYSELCVRTRFPRELDSFITAVLRQRNELDRGVGDLCLFVQDRDSWLRLCDTEPSRRILVAGPELDFEAHRMELLEAARIRGHGTIYSSTNPRPDIPHIVDLVQPRKYEIEELLVKHHHGAAEARQLAEKCNGNVYLLFQILTYTSERRRWASSEAGPRLRHLALLGAWNDSSAKDKAFVAKIVGEPYETWIAGLYPLTLQEEPPVVLEGSIYRAVSRYELWQQLGAYLTDVDLRRFSEIATEILSETEPRLQLPKPQRQYADFRTETAKEISSPTLRRAVAETLALLASQHQALGSAECGRSVAETSVSTLLTNADWKRWASLTGELSLLAEAAPDVFLSAVDHGLNSAKNPIRPLFGESEDPLFGRTYHTGLLWALEVLAWHQDYLSRVALCLARMVDFPLPHNMANNALNSLRSIFLTWLPQTLASVEHRSAAVKKVTEDYPEVGWRLLLAILPESHQIGDYNPRPVWRNWFDKEWTGRVTRHEMTRQVVNYANLAVKLAVADLRRLDELIGRWDHLPREAVDEILKFLAEPAFNQRPEEERFVVWERLINEVHKHRTYREQDWAMPEEELRRLEAVADAIEPKSPKIRNQRLFDDHDFHFFDSTDYEKEEKKLSQARDNAVREIVSTSGLQAIIDVTARVKIPAELGAALGRIGDGTTDSFLLPAYVLNADRKVTDLVRGYVWSRYFAAGAQWLDTVALANWSPDQKATFFAFLPFQAAVWRCAEQALGSKTSDYWKRIYPNVFQARDDLQEAVTEAIKYKRGDIAVNGITAMRFNKQQVPISLALAAVKTLLASYRKGDHLDHHDLVEVIKLLQKSNEINIEELTAIEFQTLNLLDRFSGAAPVVLEKRLATDPEFFHTMVVRAFRSERSLPEDKSAPTDKDEMAGQVFRLLYRWQTPPGALDNERFDEDLLKRWIDKAEKLCEESGHWRIAQQLIGTAFVYEPLGLQGLLKYPAAAKILDRSDEMRRGFTTGLFNLRGVHGYTAGKEELEIANKYYEFAERFELAGFIQIAATLRRLSESYKRESEHESRENPYDGN
jgi:hypothetical protein